MLDVLSRRGGEHETNHVARLLGEGKTVVEIDMPGNTVAALEEAQERRRSTRCARASTSSTRPPSSTAGGAATPTSSSGSRRPSDLGDWSYEVADAKLARRVKAAALLQMCAYSEQLARLQGVAPRHIHVITGDGERHTVKLTDYSAYYRTLKARYEALVLGAPTDTYPDPVDHCGVCRWVDVCTDRRRADDHLSLVAGMRRDQTRKLTAVSITTTTELAARTRACMSTASATRRSSGSATRPSSR